MSFMDNLSKLAKSVGEGASTVAKKSGDAVEITKLHLSIKSNEDKIKEVYTQLGQKVYEKFKESEEIDTELIDKCREIDLIKENIEELKKKILEVKNVKLCPSCHTELESSIEFCPKCGAKQEIPAKPETQTEKEENKDKNE